MSRQDSSQYPLDGYAKSAKKIHIQKTHCNCEALSQIARDSLRHPFQFFLGALGALAVKKVLP
jgi:hypothetical protein